MRKFLFTLIVLSSLSAPLFAQEGYRVVEVVGRCEVLQPSQEWKPLLKGAQLVMGSAIRTGPEPDSGVELVADPHFENSLRIGPGSRVGFLNLLPLRVSLDEGSLFVLKEEQRYLNRDTELSPEVRILTRDFLVSVRQGGCELDTAGPNVMLKVFGESMQVQSKTQSGYAEASSTVEEGFRYSKDGQTRLEYPDYAVWQAWYKKNNEKRDELVRAGR